jgi:hypothetical protein
MSAMMLDDDDFVETHLVFALKDLLYQRLNHSLDQLHQITLI